MKLGLYSVASQPLRHTKVTGSSPVGTRYNSPQRKAFRRKWGAIPKYVQDHHVIPKQWRRHPSVLRFGYDVNSSQNLIMMPTYYGHYKFELRSQRYTHDGGHHKYNVYVGLMLDCIQDEDEFEYFICFLKKTLRRGEDNIPWYY